MKLSTKGRYGVKAMVDLAVNYENGLVSLKSIAIRQGISENYLEQLFAILKKDGLVKSVRGAQGGYKLSSSPSEITVGSILRALEGSFAPSDCIEEDEPKDCENYNKCITKILWIKMRDSINNVLNSTTLKDLIDESNLSNE